MRPIALASGVGGKADTPEIGFRRLQVGATVWHRHRFVALNPTAVPHIALMSNSIFQIVAHNNLIPKLASGRAARRHNPSKHRTRRTDGGKRIAAQFGIRDGIDSLVGTESVTIHVRGFTNQVSHQPHRTIPTGCGIAA